MRAYGHTQSLHQKGAGEKDRPQEGGSPQRETPKRAVVRVLAIGGNGGAREAQ